MNAFRAKRIADNLGNLHGFRVCNDLYSLQVEYRGKMAIFDSEVAFWAFVFNLARASQEEDALSEAEARLQA